MTVTVRQGTLVNAGKKKAFLFFFKATVNLQLSFLFRSVSVFIKII